MTKSEGLPAQPGAGSREEERDGADLRRRVEALTADLRAAGERIAALTEELRGREEALATQAAEIARLSQLLRAAEEGASPSGAAGDVTRILLALHQSRRSGWLPWPLRARADRAAVRRTGLFDAAWYVKANPDVAAAGVDPIGHYLRHGIGENRAPNPGPAATGVAEGPAR